ncbi:hypothetical protein TUBRATIS_008920 [Tubulinosema ratisbonensis]|uniref:Uncharacterized protein n=1 Tax=Tubulinosema ratisbonensis TaxID=291195 RepID=A0A437ANM5_9MICR|nr:hypothetical protein TUBRATIS_008920 [Tubulinosema ratisbonensis]
MKNNQNINEEMMATLNSLLANPSESEVEQIFEPESYIRLNHVFFSPKHLCLFRKFLENYGLISLEIVSDGLIFNFQRTFIHFRGFFEIYSKGKIYSFELNFEATTSSEEGRVIMVGIETFLRKCDAMFFLAYNTNVDATILHHPLSHSVSFLGRREEED